MPFQLPPLPYSNDALQPFVSANTLNFHHGKHHKAYVDTLNSLVQGTSLEQKSLEDIIQDTTNDRERQKIFNNAGQVWNHTFFWNCMKPRGGGVPSGEIARRIDKDLGGYSAFKDSFLNAAVGQFGSGWAWLVLDTNGQLKVTATPNAVLPMVQGQMALLTCDVWEHAYYLDYQNERRRFVETFLDNLVNWEFVEEQYRNQGEGNRAAARDYQEAQRRFAQSGPVEEKAQEAKAALESAEGAELEKARSETAARAAEEDPALRKPK